MNHTEQKIKELEELANEFNNKLKDLREEAKREEVVYKAGDWIIMIADYANIQKGEIHQIEERQCEGRDWWVMKGTAMAPLEDLFRKATNEEIEKHLIDKAEKKGFVFERYFEGVRDCDYKDGADWNPKKHKGKVGSGWRYDAPKDILYNSGWDLFVVYEKGQWATLKHQITIGSNKVEFFPDHIQVGCTRVELETIEQIYNHFKK
jgi:hypothetical protein